MREVGEGEWTTLAASSPTRRKEEHSRYLYGYLPAFPHAYARAFLDQGSIHVGYPTYSTRDLSRFSLLQVRQGDQRLAAAERHLKQYYGRFSVCVLSQKVLVLAAAMDRTQTQRRNHCARSEAKVRADSTVIRGLGLLGSVRFGPARF